MWAEYPFGHPGVWSGKETSFLFNKYFFETDSGPVSRDKGGFISCIGGKKKEKKKKREKEKEEEKK